MTVASTITRVQYTGNGVTTDFAFGEVFKNAADLLVDLRDPTGTSVASVLNGGGTYDYTLTGAGQDSATGEYLSGAIVTFNTAPPAGYLVTLFRDPVPTQTAAIAVHGKLPANTINTEFDALTMMVQALLDRAGRSLMAPVNDPLPQASMVLPPPPQRANLALGFDGIGRPKMFAPAGAGGGGTAVLIAGLTSGFLTLATAPVASGTLRFPAGNTDFTGSGGPHQVVQQSALGAPLTVGQLATGDLSDIGTFSLNTSGSVSGSSMVIRGATSGTLALQTAAVAGNNLLRFPAGTTDFTATGGAHQVVRQSTLGGPFIVGQLATADLSDIATFNLNTSGSVTIAGMTNGGRSFWTDTLAGVTDPTSAAAQANGASMTVHSNFAGGVTAAMIAEGANGTSAMGIYDIQRSVLVTGARQTAAIAGAHGAYVQNNAPRSAAAFTAGTGGASSATLTVSAMTSGRITPSEGGLALYQGAVTTANFRAYIIDYGSGTGSTGTYTLDRAITLANGTACNTSMPPFPQSIGYIGEFVANADGAGVWGLNYIMSDSMAASSPNGNPARFLFNEIDFNFASPNSQGVGLMLGGYSSAATVASATGLQLNPLDGAALNPGTGTMRWTQFLLSSHGATNTFAIVGAQRNYSAGVAPTSSSSQLLQFQGFDDLANFQSAGLQLSMGANVASFVINGPAVSASHNYGAIVFSLGGTQYAAINNTALYLQRPVITPVYTVATLPPLSVGMRAMVSDATSLSYGTIPVGGGTYFSPVYATTSSWVIG